MVSEGLCRAGWPGVRRCGGRAGAMAMVWAGLAVLALTACSPAFNWRTLRDDAVPLQALMPCKPDSAQREVPLGGSPHTLQMHSCEAGGLTFAIAWAALGNEAAAAAALVPWREATQATLKAQAPEPAAGGALMVPGAARALTLRAQGTRPTGEPVQVVAVYFSHQARVYQAAVYGRSLPAEATAAFFDALRLP